MIEDKNVWTTPNAILPDMSLFDIDIDFDLNDGKGAWVVVLRRDERFGKPLPDRAEDRQ